MIQPIPNANFTQLSQASVHCSQEPAYQQYRSRWMESPKRFIVGDFPIHLDVEATNRCNLKCVFCDKLPYLSPDQMGDMDIEMYRMIVDEGKENGLCSIKLSYRGEPLLHKKLPEMVAYAKGQGIIDVYFNTNGMLLTERVSEKLIDAGLDRVSVSIEGIDPIAFERERRGADYKKILSNVDGLMRLRDRIGVSHPKVRVQTVALPRIDLRAYVRFWEGRVDEVAAIDHKIATEDDRNFQLTDSEWACPQLWQRMTIEWNGAIFPCNNDDFRKLSPGNVAEKTISDCWKDPIVESARDFHQQGKSHMVAACNGCPWRTTQIKKRRIVSENNIERLI
jgi:radical SAM protein with 4Fe4S-binding SPASM domain